jgi:hypothetical protein
LESYDLIDFFIPRNNKIFPLNKIKDSLALTRNDTIVSKYYLVWRKPDGNRKNSYLSTTTKNFQFSEYINELSYDPKQLPSSSEVSEHIKRLENGWNYPIEIIVAYYTAMTGQA